jgi:hypothetical protein
MSINMTEHHILSETERAAANMLSETFSAPTKNDGARHEKPIARIQALEPPEQTFVIDDDAENIRSYFAEGEVIEGNLRLRHGIRIAGTIDGRVLVENGTVVVEKTGTVTGGIEANGRIIVDGTVGKEDRVECTDQSTPSIRTPGLLAVMGTGRVYGCYQYGRIATYDDATIEGLGKKIKG